MELVFYDCGEKLLGIRLSLSLIVRVGLDEMTAVELEIVLGSLQYILSLLVTR